MNVGKRRPTAWEAETVARRNRERDVRKAYAEYFGQMPPGSLPLTLVLRQRLTTPHPGFRPQISREQATSCVARFIYAVERKIYRGLARPDARANRKRLCRFFVMEWGNDLGLHLHGAMEVAPSMTSEQQVALMTREWSRLDNALRLHVGDEATRRWKEYTLKAKSGELADNVDVENLYLT